MLDVLLQSVLKQYQECSMLWAVVNVIMNHRCVQHKQCVCRLADCLLPYGVLVYPFPLVFLYVLSLPLYIIIIQLFDSLLLLWSVQIQCFLWLSCYLFCPFSLSPNVALQVQPFYGPQEIDWPIYIYDMSAVGSGQSVRPIVYMQLQNGIYMCVAWQDV
jgi:hypothetical protein